VDSLAAFVRNGAGFNKAHGLAADVAQYAEHSVYGTPESELISAHN
jgi:hypothetical protein